MNTRRLIALVATTAMLAASAVVLTAGPSAAAEEYLVNTTTDAPDVAPGDGACETATPAQCSLRAAFEEAAADGDSSAIEVPPGTYELTLGAIQVAEQILVEGSGAEASDVTIIAAPAARAIEVSFGGTARLRDVRIEGAATPYSGGIRVDGAELFLERVELAGNANGTQGGAIEVVSSGFVQVSQSTISGNSALGHGGGIYGEDSQIEVSGSVISDNSASFLGTAGGGIYALDTDVSVSDSTIESNWASSSTAGAGLHAIGAGSTLTLSGSTVRDHDGAGVYSEAAAQIFGSSFSGNGREGAHVDSASVTGSSFEGNGRGLVIGAGSVIASTMADNADAGLVVLGPSVDVQRSTVSGNRGEGLGAGGDTYGSGIVHMGGGKGTPLTLHHVTVTANTVAADPHLDLEAPAASGGVTAVDGEIEVSGSILGGNEGAQCLEAPGTGVELVGHNLVTDSSCDGLTGDTVVVPDVRLSALGAHGGGTRTHVPMPGSPAIDQVEDLTQCTTVDQRSEPAGIDGDGDGTDACDLGAVERQPSDPAPPAPGPGTDPEPDEDDEDDGELGGSAGCPADVVTDDGLGDTGPEGSEVETAVDCLVAYGITVGSGDRDGDGIGDFHPQGETTRAQMTSFLVRLLRLVDDVDVPVDAPDAFTDDDSSLAAPNPHELNTNAAAALGVTTGKVGDVNGDGLVPDFAPNESVDRAQMASFLIRILDLAGVELPAVVPDAFTDDDGIHAEGDIDVLAALGIARGDGSGAYQPGAAVTRGQMALFLTRVLDHLVTTGAMAPLA